MCMQQVLLRKFSMNPLMAHKLAAALQQTDSQVYGVVHSTDKVRRGQIDQASESTAHCWINDSVTVSLEQKDVDEAKGMKRMIVTEEMDAPA